MRSVAARGSELVFDFLHPDALSETAPPSMRATNARARAVGEPVITSIDPGPLGAELAATGWTLVEHLDDADIQRRYFATRTDGYRAFPLVHLACAGVV
jgi:O-methyltransferase involved in polyketide biosynthesis